ncbi:MAG: cell division protein FtsL [Chromatiales bacterium 21-64-14]|nr:MAG: cell division protein FtsL [Chromatiales bacterium 21-64-14]HQU14906.1 cell division protein FtsL [Gammaproteobacteria bacterium]
MQRSGVLALLALVLASALGVVYATHETRRLFVELQHLRAERDSLNVEWGRLELEESTWGTHSRVERIARTQLGMHSPAPDSVVIVRP